MSSPDLGALVAAWETGLSPLDDTVKFLMDLPQIPRNESSTLGRLLEVVASPTFPVAISVELLAHGLGRLDPSGTVMTSHHVALARQAMGSGVVQAALPVLDRNVVFYPVPSRACIQESIRDAENPSAAEYLTVDSGLTQRLTVTDVLQYELFRGMCYISQHKWRQALAALERVITHPIKDGGCSKIQVEAYNKWILVGLLADGKAPSMPATVGVAAQKVYGTTGKPYLAVASAFEEKTAHELKTQVENGEPGVWAGDGNDGLIGQVIRHYQRWQVLHLRRVYSKMSLEQVRARTQSGATAKPLETVAEVEALVQDMIVEGMLDGHVESGETPCLVFHEEEEYSEATFAEEMAVAAARITALSPLVALTNERLGTSRDYVRHLIREQKREPDGVLNQLLNQLEDEDLMETSS